MMHTSIRKAKKDLNKMVDSCIKYDDVFVISKKKGNVIMLSEKNFNNLIESFYSKDIYQSIKEVVKTPTSELIKQSPWE